MGAIRYPIPWAVVTRLLVAIGRKAPRDFRADAHGCINRLHPPLQVEGLEHVPVAGAQLITVNHFSRPGFRAWWIPLAVSATVPIPIHWVITRRWLFHNRPRARPVLVPAFEWLIGRIAQVYGFATMPPMPPDPAEAAERAHAVRRLLTYARQTPSPVIGLAPEGRDSPDGRLAWPPLGAGRLVEHLARAGLAILPAGIYEAEGRLCLRFGPAYSLETPANASATHRDHRISCIVMSHIAARLPKALRGDFG